MTCVSTYVRSVEPTKRRRRTKAEMEAAAAATANGEVAQPRRGLKLA
jgi:hypothetical protein